MTGRPDPLTGQPEPAAARQKADLLADVLAQVRVSGSIFLRGEYTAPWAFDSPEAHELVQLLAPGAPRLILFHIVREGRAWVSSKGVRLELEPGDMALLPHADRHVMGSPGFTRAVPIADILPPPPWQGIPVCRFEGGGDNTGVVCGYMTCDELLFNPFLRRLPPLILARPRPGPGAEWVQACIRYALDEQAQARPGGATLMTRLPELLLVEALRVHAEGLPSDRDGWLAALNDPVVSRSLAAIHADPARGWNLEELAACAATSRSVLDERFRKLLGQSPIRYLAEWRIQIAAELLRTTGIKLATVAERCGYGSEKALSRAFQRHVGMSPGRWRAGGAGAT